MGRGATAISPRQARAFHGGRPRRTPSSELVRFDPARLTFDGPLKAWMVLNDAASIMKGQPRRSHEVLSLCGARSLTALRPAAATGSKGVEATPRYGHVTLPIPDKESSCSAGSTYLSDVVIFGMDA